MLYRPGCCRARKRSRTRGRPKGPSEPQVLIAPGAVAGGKSRKVHRPKMRKITKYFTGVKALSDVDFRLMKGEVHSTATCRIFVRSLYEKLISRHIPTRKCLDISETRFKRKETVRKIEE